MAILSSDDFTGQGTSSITGRTLNNAQGGTKTHVWEAHPGSTGNSGDGAGRVVFAANTASLIRDPDIRKVKVEFDRDGGTSQIIVSGFVSPTGSSIGATRVGLLLTSSLTNFRLGDILTIGGSFVNRATKTITAPATRVFLELDATAAPLVVARMYGEDGTTVLHEIQHTFTTFPTGDGWGFGGFQGGGTGKWDLFSANDGPVDTGPVLSTPTGSALAATRATGNITTTGINGNIYALDSTGTPDAATIIATGTAHSISAAGTFTILTNGLVPSTTGYRRHYIHVPSFGINSAVSRSATFNTPAPLAPPSGTGNTVPLGGHSVRVEYTPVGVVDSATASIPVATIPNGAVAESAKSMTLSGGIWIAMFTPVEGDYGVPVILANNEDNILVNIPGAQAFDIIALKGFDQDV